MGTVDARPLAFRPGAKREYSNTGYELLAMVIERVSGMSYQDFLQGRIFKPLGMTSTYVRDAADTQPNVATEYEYFALGPWEHALHIDYDVLVPTSRSGSGHPSPRPSVPATPVPGANPLVIAAAGRWLDRAVAGHIDLTRMRADPRARLQPAHRAALRALSALGPWTYKPINVDPPPLVTSSSSARRKRTSYTAIHRMTTGRFPVPR